MCTGPTAGTPQMCVLGMGIVKKCIITTLIYTAYRSNTLTELYD